MAVRNGRLAALNVTATGFTTLLQVPDGFSAIVKSIDLVNGSNTAADINLYLASSAGILVNWVSANVLPTASLTWEGWRALSSGDFVYINTTQIPLPVFVSGAMLPNFP